MDLHPSPLYVKMKITPELQVSEIVFKQKSFKD